MSFKEVIGHERPIQVLKTTLQRRRLAHAYLFDGDEGIGKNLAAKAFAKAANCTDLFTDRAGIDACGRCRSCAQMEAGTHPDFMTVNPDGAMIKIGQVRAIQEQIPLKPLAGQYRFVIFNEAETMNEEAANALLKSLEEPPAQTLLILITSRPHAILPTIVSRCQRIRFTPLTDQQVIQILQMKRPGSTLPAEKIAPLAMGRVGLALALDPEVLVKEWDAARRVLLEVSTSPVENILEFAQEYAQDRDKTERALHWIGLWLRDLLMVKYRCLPALEPSSRQFSGIASRAGVEEVMALARLIQWIYKALIRNINKQLALEVLLLQIRHTLRQ